MHTDVGTAGALPTDTAALLASRRYVISCPGVRVSAPTDGLTRNLIRKQRHQKSLPVVFLHFLPPITPTFRLGNFRSGIDTSATH
jgi:hypothetical protein